MRIWLPKLCRYATFGAAVLALMAAGTLTVSQFFVLGAARPFIYAGIDEVPARRIALVPGVGSARPGRPPGNLLERLKTALALYQAHKVEAILVSGVADGSVRDEVVEMRRWLEFRGVPRADILVDPAGHRTFDTMRRAADLLHVADAIVCTQVGNMGRSLFLARSAGIDAVGLIAPSAKPPSAATLRLDALKTVLAIADIYLLNRQPRVADARGVIDQRALVAARPLDRQVIAER